jgi:squalene-associated FAD-dependent desaturase
VTAPQRVAVVGGGWAGLAAAVRAAQDGHHVTVFEASRHWGGRARRLQLTLPDGTATTVDNGQHILIGAYTDTLRLMALVGVDVNAALLRVPLAMVDPAGNGLRLPHWPGVPAWLNDRLPLAVLGGVLQAKGWSWADKLALLATATRWQLGGFTCASHTSVAQLCVHLPEALRRNFIDPLCVSALNTPAERASGQVFLRVLKDALFGVPGGSDLLLPRVDLGTLFPEAAVRWLSTLPHPADLRLGQRVQRLMPATRGWAVNGEGFDRVVWANSEQKQALALIGIALSAINNGNTTAVQRDWLAHTEGLAFEPIATVYAWCPSATGPHVLPQPMTALWPNAQHPGQFVFDRSWLGGPRGLLAFVVSASVGDAQALESQVCAQAQAQLGLAITPLKTVVEKRATFACTPGLQRPTLSLAPGLVAAGDHVAGPYPATLEGAVRSGWAAGEVGG